MGVSRHRISEAVQPPSQYMPRPVRQLLVGVDAFRHDDTDIETDGRHDCLDIVGCHEGEHNGRLSDGNDSSQRPDISNCVEYLANGRLPGNMLPDRLWDRILEESKGGRVSRPIVLNSAG